MARLLGTAGHVDHGKTSLIRALTGIDADRLPEEKARGMTIDLGFAWTDLPGVGRVSIVDVPGHEKFLTNMLAGAMGMDVALLCVAADEGVMPQTREHLAILSLLPVQSLVVALTKTDMVDEEWRDFMVSEVADWLAGSRFAGSPILPVSARSGEGLDSLRAALSQALSAEGHSAEGRWRLPIDRAFVMKGHGLVVTGSLAGGRVQAGESLTIQPTGLEARVKSIHSHDETLESADPGRRVALNLTGVKAEQVHRGMMAGPTGSLAETECLDLKMNWIERPKHGAEVRLAIGAADCLGRVFLNDHDPDLAQVVLREPCAAALGLPVILRRHSPPDLLGGGTVAAALAERRRKSEAPAPTVEEAGDEGIVRRVDASDTGVATEEICQALGRTAQSLGTVFEGLKQEGQLVGFAGLWFTPDSFERAWRRFRAGLASLHAAEPAKALQPRDAAIKAARLPWHGKPAERILAHWTSQGRLRANGSLLALSDHMVELKPKQEVLLGRITALLDESGIGVPRPNDITQKLGVPHQAVEEILRIGVEAGRLVRVDEGQFYTVAGLARLVEDARQRFGANPFTAGEFRDALGGSRRHVIPFLERLDAQGTTVRQGDSRRFYTGP